MQVALHFARQLLFERPDWQLAEFMNVWRKALDAVKAEVHALRPMTHACVPHITAASRLVESRAGMQLNCLRLPYLVLFQTWLGVTKVTLPDETRSRYRPERV